MATNNYSSSNPRAANMADVLDALSSGMVISERLPISDTDPLVIICSPMSLPFGAPV
jgi:hypothetical protein